MGFSKPSVLLDWINDDSAAKYTIPSSAAQLAGHINDTNADEKIFNFCWWRLSAWIEFLDNTFDATGNNINAPNSTTITETVAPAASTVALDAGGIKSWDASSNAIFSVTEPGVVTIGYNANDIISLTAGVLSVATATAADLVKLHALTPSAADLNLLLGAVGNGLLVADLTKLANIDASDAEIDQLDGNTVGGSSAGDIATIDDTQALTNKTIDADNNTVSNLAHGSEVDDPTTGVHGVGGGDVVGTALTQTLTNKTLTSPKINEDVVLAATSTQLDATVTGAIINTDRTEIIPVLPGRIGLERRGLLSRIPGGDGSAVNFLVQSELLKSNSATSTASDKLIDSGGGFSGVIEVDDIVCNRTDDTAALVTAVDSDTALSLDADIFVSSDNYEIFDKDSGNITIGYGSATILYDYKTQAMALSGAMVGQGALKTDTEEETADVVSGSSTRFYFTDIGEYGFWPNVKFEADTTNIDTILFNRGTGGGGAGSTTYVPLGITLGHSHGFNRQVYVQIRYTTASGEICWVFILKDKITKKYIRMHKCPDHPAISCHDVEAVHHPFYGNYDPEKHNMFCIPLNKTERAEVEDLREWKNELPGLTFLEAIKKYYDINENPKSAKWPDIPVTIGLDRNRKIMKAKIPKRDYIKQAELVKKK